ncbi:SusC/RagA family TonB-linked outer membrane protein [Terrimonas alba]|uniref:SusC/RagA family TonB-linked outer membrane protein n=1 Tax=Terrimonas alba TaxID=3349636 RepID=UPI0035F239F4
MKKDLSLFKLLLCGLLSLCFVYSGYSQSKTISGKVTGKDNSPLEGATVNAKGSTISTQTKDDGSFSIQVPASVSALIVSFVGYNDKEVEIGSSTILNVNLVAGSESLQDVVVIGYGTRRKSDLTGSVSTVKASQLHERPASSLSQALAGRVTGVQVNSNSGRPGGRTNVRIRGFSSINSSNNPLYVIDGVMIPMGNQAQASQAIDYINPNDIISVEVLKDASSTAIYGARGANGVILVTTKRGKAGGGKVTYDADFSVPTIGPIRAKVLNAKEFLAVEDEAYRNMEKFDPAGWAAGKYVGRNPALARTDPRLFDANGNPYYDTDWLKEATQNKLSNNQQLGFSGGNDHSNYSVSLGYRNDQGLILTSYLKRYSARFSFDDQIKAWLKIGGTLSYTNQSENIIDQSDQVNRSIVEDFPFLPVKYPDGTWADNRNYPNAEGRDNVVHRVTDTRFILNTQTTLGSFYSNINLAKGLEMRTVLGANIISQENNGSESRTLARNQRGIALSNNRKETFWSLENYFTYNKHINEIHSINALLGLSWQHTNFFSSGARIENFSTDYFSYNNLGAGSTNPSASSNASEFAFNSYFGRINYTLKEKYLVTFTGRMDGSSKFGENHKYAFFPSAALAWRVSEEDFLKGHPVISSLKVRTSYGLTGNSEIPPYSSLSLLSSNYAAVINNARVGGTGVNRLANPNLKWEKTAQTDFGVELGLLKNRITLEADLYYRKTTDMLLDAPVPRTSGYAVIRKNVGSMENKGLELALTGVVIDKKDFSWSSTLNMSMNRNKVLSLATPADIFNVGGANFTNPTNIIRIGEAAGSFWGLVRLGTWSEAEAAEAAKFTSYRNNLTILPGDIKYLDVNGDYKITDADRMIIGNGSPKAFGAFNNNFRYRNFGLLFELQYSFGNDILDMTSHSSEDRVSLANSYKTVLNAWTPKNQNTPIAQLRDTRAGYVTNVDTRWIKDGSFIRGKNILLSYNLPLNLVNKLSLERIRIYASVQNLFIITYDDLNGDPEATPTGGYADDGRNVFSQGMFWHSYPKPTLYMLGINVGL